MPDKCEWKDEREDVWATSCGGLFQFEDGGPADNSFAFCPYCGKPLVVEE